MTAQKGIFGVMTAPEPQPEPAAEAPRPGKSRRALGMIGEGLNDVRLWFRAFRRTRPFWGALWTIIAGLWIIRTMSFSIGLALTGGWSHAAGYVMGGGLILFGVVAIVAPYYRSLAGLDAFLIALGAFPTANLGGYLLGSILGIIGSSMIWAWGEKKPKKPSRKERRLAAAEGSAETPDAGLGLMDVAPDDVTGTEGEQA